MENSFSWPGWETARPISRGSFGAVYEIQRDVFGETEKAAVRVISIPESKYEIAALRTEGYDDESIAEYYGQYVRKLFELFSSVERISNHQNIAHYKDIRWETHSDGIGYDVFIKMDLLVPLTKHLTDETAEEQAIHLGLDLCRALSSAHAINLVHGDIKPQNILLDKCGNYKLIDFSLGSIMREYSNGHAIGAKDFVPPEIYHEKPYENSSDIYSLGLVLYWLLNERRRPFFPLPPKKPDMNTIIKARFRQVSGEQIPPPAHGSRELKRIVLKACAYDPSERYQTADCMLADLEKLIN